ncbi:MAG: ribbon-helix-helix protein, CopG family [Desulfobacterales bacterium]|nr:ribbon-helix-helix protein, CopG family [Desulfobacterales bacterium]
MIRTQVQLTEEQARALRDLASARQVSVAELIRQSVDALIRSLGEVDIKERRRRAIAAAGRFRSGASDISAKHDEYLAEAFQACTATVGR